LITSSISLSYGPSVCLSSALSHCLCAVRVMCHMGLAACSKSFVCSFIRMAWIKAVFSTGAIILSKRRNRLADDIFEKLLKHLFFIQLFVMWHICECRGWQACCTIFLLQEKSIWKVH